MVRSGVPVVSQWCPGGVAAVSRSYPNPVPLAGLRGGWCPVGEVVGGVMVVGGVVGRWSSGGGCGVVGGGVPVPTTTSENLRLRGGWCSAGEVVGGVAMGWCRSVIRSVFWLVCFSVIRAVSRML